MIRLADLVPDRKRLSFEEFASDWDTPVLLHRSTDDDEEARSFKTDVTDPHATRMELAAGLTTDPDLVVVKVEKRPGGVFKDRVGIGRTRNNDIHLPYPKISKFHAYFTWSADRSEFYLTDAGSTNGTYVNGHRLTHSQPVIVPERALVSFGRYHFRFHLPRGLFDVLGQIAYGSGDD
jgi:pSer/pThr/pTyr-binding forkhead associated (FHA) protein